MQSAFVAASSDEAKMSSDKRKPEEFIRRVHQLPEVFPHDRVINIDENNWRVVAAGVWTWVDTGSEAVSCIIDENGKGAIMVVAGIDSAGTKLPLTVVGKGKTHRCLVVLNLPPEVWSITSSTSWNTGDVICNYFRLLRQYLYPTGQFVVLLNTFAAHWAVITKAVAEEWGIDLVFIPPGCTDALQLLDGRIFGTLQAYARRLRRTHYHETHGEKTTRSIMANNLLVACDRITKEITDSARSIY
jgi:hypothetical protein